MTFSKLLLSGSTNGKNIKVTGTATGASVTVHTAVAGTSTLDEIWLYAHNTSAADVLLTIEWGGVAAPDDQILITIPAQAGRKIVCDGRLLQNGLVIKAFAASADVIVLDGFVNRIAVI